MAKKSSKEKKNDTIVHRTLGLHENPQRKTLILLAAVMLVIAVIVIAGEAVASVSGHESCSGIILATQRYQCYVSLANTTGNVSYCKAMPSQQLEYNCIDAAALYNRNASKCAMLNSSPYYHTECVDVIATTTGSESYCSALDPANQSSCSYTIAEMSNFSIESDCNGISEPANRSLCTANYYYHAAYSSGNESLCAPLSSSKNGTVVSSFLAGSAAYLSESTYLAMSPRDFCYLYMSERYNDSTGCSGISNASTKSDCYSYLTPLNLTQSNSTEMNVLCQSQGSSISPICQFAVYTEEGLSNGNVSKCSLISNGTYRENCITGIATQYNDSSDCNLLTNKSVRAACAYQASLYISNYTP